MSLLWDAAGLLEGVKGKKTSFCLEKKPWPALKEQVGTLTSSAAKRFDWDFGVAKNLGILSTPLLDSRWDYSFFLQGLLKLYLVLKISYAFITHFLQELGLFLTHRGNGVVFLQQAEALFS